MSNTNDNTPADAMDEDESSFSEPNSYIRRQFKFAWAVLKWPLAVLIANGICAILTIVWLRNTVDAHSNAGFSPRESRSNESESNEPVFTVLPQLGVLTMLFFVDGILARMGLLVLEEQNRKLAQEENNMDTGTNSGTSDKEEGDEEDETGRTSIASTDESRLVYAKACRILEEFFRGDEVQSYRTVSDSLQEERDDSHASDPILVQLLLLVFVLSMCLVATSMSLLVAAWASPKTQKCFFLGSSTGDIPAGDIDEAAFAASVGQKIPTELHKWATTPMYSDDTSTTTTNYVGLSDGSLFFSGIPPSNISENQYVPRSYLVKSDTDGVEVLRDYPEPAMFIALVDENTTEIPAVFCCLVNSADAENRWQRQSQRLACYSANSGSLKDATISITDSSVFFSSYMDTKPQCDSTAVNCGFV